MRVLVDADTGELVEHLPEALLDLTPYDYTQAKAAHMRCSRQRSEALAAYKAAVNTLAAAEKAYRVELAREVVRQEGLVGKTNAEQAAKGEHKVSELREAFTIAEGMKFAAYLGITGCDEDRKGVGQLVSWSKVVATGPWGEGQG